MSYKATLISIDEHGKQVIYLSTKRHYYNNPLHNHPYISIMADIVTFNSPSILSSSSIPYNKLFAHADVFDYVLMFVGGVGAIVHGIALPIFFIFFGKLIDSLGNLTIDPSTAPHAVNKVSYNY